MTSSNLEDVAKVGCSGNYSWTPCIEDKSQRCHRDCLNSNGDIRWHKQHIPLSKPFYSWWDFCTTTTTRSCSPVPCDSASSLASSLPSSPKPLGTAHAVIFLPTGQTIAL